MAGEHVVWKTLKGSDAHEVVAESPGVTRMWHMEVRYVPGSDVGFADIWGYEDLSGDPAVKMAIPAGEERTFRFDARFVTISCNSEHTIDYAFPCCPEATGPAPD